MVAWQCIKINLGLTNIGGNHGDYIIVFSVIDQSLVQMFSALSGVLQKAVSTIQNVECSLTIAVFILWFVNQVRCFLSLSAQKRAEA